MDKSVLQQDTQGSVLVRGNENKSIYSPVVAQEDVLWGTDVYVSVKELLQLGYS